jgi:hypothetical protein
MDKTMHAKCQNDRNETLNNMHKIRVYIAVVCSSGAQNALMSAYCMVLAGSNVHVGTARCIIQV